MSTSPSSKLQATDMRYSSLHQQQPPNTPQRPLNPIHNHNPPPRLHLLLPPLLHLLSDLPTLLPLLPLRPNLDPPNTLYVFERLPHVGNSKPSLIAQQFLRRSSASHLAVRITDQGWERESRKVGNKAGWSDGESREELGAR